MRKIEIIIKGEEGAGKTTVLDLIKKALVKEDYWVTTLDPVPRLGWEDRAIARKGYTTIHLFTEQEEVTNV